MTVIYKVTQMSGVEIPIYGTEKLKKLLQQAESSKLVLTDYGIVNVASIDSITPDTKRMAQVREILNRKPGYGIADMDGAVMEVLGQSPFIDLLNEKQALPGRGSIQEPREFIASGGPGHGPGHGPGGGRGL